MASSHVLIFAATGYNTINILKCFKCSRFSQSHCKRLCQKKTSDSYGRDFQCSTFGYKSYLIFLIIDHNQGMSVIFSPFLESHERDIWRFYLSSLSWRYLFSWNEALVDIILNDPVNWPIYRYFEKDCRKKCTRQSRTVSWVVLNALSFKEVWKNDTRGHGRMFVGAKKRNKSRFDWATVSGTVYWSYPILPFGIVACTFCPTTFLEIAVYAGADLGGGCRGCAPPPLRRPAVF